MWRSHVTKKSKELSGCVGGDGVSRGADFLPVVHGEEQELAEDMAAMEALTGKRAVPIGAFGKPELQGLAGEIHRGIFNELMIAVQPDRRNRVHDIGFHGENLEAARVNPRAPLEGDGNDVVANVVGEHGVGPAGALLEMDNPDGTAVPGAAPFAAKVVSDLEGRMKDERQGGQADRSNVRRKILSGNGTVAEFLDVELARAHLLDIHDVVEFASFAGSLETHGVEIGVLNLFGRGEARDVLNELVNAEAGGLQDVAERTSGGGVEIEFVVVNIGGRPIRFRGGRDLRKRRKRRIGRRDGAIGRFWAAVR